MLAPLPSPGPLAPDNHFYDHFQRTLYTLDKGSLTAHQQTHNQSQPIPMSQSSTQPQSPLIPSLKVVSGKVVSNAQGNIIASRTEQAKVRSTVEVKDHSHWEWHVPLSLSSIELGLYVQKGEQGGETEQLISFNSSTSRTVTFWLNGKELNVWVNGTKPHKKAVKVLDFDLSIVKCYPFAKIKEKGSTLIFVPFLTTPSVLSISSYNPFGTLHLQPPALDSQCPEIVQKQSKLTKLMTLSEDKMLLVSQNNVIQVVSRNQEHQFEFQSSFVEGTNIFGLFSKEQYELLKNWRKELPLFVLKNTLTLQFTYSWIRYLICELDRQNSERYELYNLLLKKLIIIRPYLKLVGIQIPNLLFHCLSDIQNFSSALNYFSGYTNMKHLLLNISSPAPVHQVQGEIRCITSNYLLSLKESTVIIYYLGSGIKEVFREKIQNLNFSKRSLVESYNEEDLRCIQKDGSYLYKILNSALSSKKEEEIHKVNPEDLKELKQIFKVEETLAKTALENTGNVEEALVWIFAKKKDRTKKEEIYREDKDSSFTFCLFEVKTIFTRLFLSVNNNVFVLGVTPNRMSQWIQRKENQFINLSTFKHEHQMQEIAFQNWYMGLNHPSLSLLDSIQLKITSELFITDNSKIYFVFTNEQGRHQQEISINLSALFEEKTSIEIKEPIEMLPTEFQQGELVRSIQGELISENVDEKSYLPGTTVVIRSKLYSNSTLMGVPALKIIMNTEASLFGQSVEPAKTLPLTIEQCPPGVNKNYSISSLLISNSSFLGNYPQGIMMRHLHNLVMNVRSFKLRRCVNRKNVNYIERGWIIFKDVWGHDSEKFHFQFEPKQEEITLTFEEGPYWKSIYLEPKFTTQKKLPFEIGSFTVTGSCMSPQAYLQECSRKLTKILNTSSKQRIFLHNLTPLSRKTIQIHVSCPNLQALQDFTIKNEKIQILEKRGVTISKQNSGFEEIESGSPDQLIKYMTKYYTNIHSFLRHLAKSTFFKLDSFDQKNVRKFVDLAIFTPQVIQDEEYYEHMFSKIWHNTHGQEYLLKFAVAFCQVPLIPLPFLKLLLTNLPPDYHQLTLKAALESIEEIRKKEYEGLKGESPYLYFQTQFYSDYYLNLINPSKKDVKTKTFNEPCIKSQILIFKSDYTRRIIVKLPAKYAITNTTLRAERCDLQSKIRYTVFVLTPQGKDKVASGCLLEHQWSQITKLPYQPEVDQLYDCETSALNMIGLDTPKIQAQYLQIELNFTENGIIAHENELTKISQVDILPQLYGVEIQPSGSLQKIDNYLNINPEDMFFLSMSPLLNNPMKKYSVTKGTNIEFIYLVPQKEDIGTLKTLLAEKIQKRELQVIVNIQRKLITNKEFSHKVTLDYLYTLTALTFTELQKGNLKISDNICDKIFKTLIQGAQGPIKMLGFKAISHKISLLIKSLQYIDKELGTLGNISFSYEQLIDIIDFTNTDLCKSLSKLILRGVPYQQKWAQLLIRMSPRTGSHEEIINYFINQEDWLKNHQILEYLSSLSDEIYLNHFLANLSFKHLSKIVLTPSAKSRLDVLLQTIVSRASDKNLVDLDVIGLIFQQREVRWEQLETVISSCPQAADTIIYQFLQSDTPEKLAREHNLLFCSAASVKYAQEFAAFLNKIYQREKSMLSELFLGLGDKCKTLHYDFLETIGNFINDSCNFGGMEGAKLLSQREVENLHAATEMLNIVQKLPEGAQLPNEDLFIDWYFSNNHYQLTPVNPVSKSPAYHLMKHLIDQVLLLVKTTDPSKVLDKYMTTLNNIKLSKRISITKRHLLFNQLHFGASILLSHTLAPGLLANVLVGGDSPLFARVINELKSSTIKNTTKANKWLPSKEIELTEHFDVKDISDVKDIQVGKVGTKVPAFRVPITHKHIRITSQENKSPTKITIGFCLNDSTENKAALLPSRVELFGGSDKTLLKIGNMTLLQDQYYLMNGIRIFAINLNGTHSQGINSIKNIQFKLQDPQLCSASDVLEGGQRSKKGATFNVSFISVYGYDSQPVDQPDYSEMYVTLLGFLGNPKYKKDLQSVISSPFFDQKLELIIQVLNDLLPNDDIEALLLSLNKEGESILQHVLKSKGANSRIVNLLLMGRLNKDNINKLILHTLDNISSDFVNIVVSNLRLASYEAPRKIAESVADFENVKHLIDNYQKNKDNSKHLYFKLITSILTVPNLYNYDLSKVISFIWSHPQRSSLYSILAAVLPYYPAQLQNCSSKNYALQLLDELLMILEGNQKGNVVSTNPQGHLQLLCTMSLNQSCLQQLLEKKAPIKIVELIKSQSSILVKYSNQVMKLLIAFFQSTCIGTPCQDQFSQILINIMTSLNSFSPNHHNFFIHCFFFPLINAFKGVPLLFVWKHEDQFLKQVTDVLAFKPIKSNSNVIAFQNSFYQAVQSVDQDAYSSVFLFINKTTESVCFKLSEKAMWDVLAKKERKYSSKQGTITVQLEKDEVVKLTPDSFKVYQQNQWEKNLLTNLTLQNINNPWILQEKYQNISSIKDSTLERCYFVPAEMEIADILKQINIGGFKIHPTDIDQIAIKNFFTGKNISRGVTLKTILSQQKEPYLKLEIQASQIFKSTTIESLAKEQFANQPFIAQQTIFKAFQEKKGLEKMITVLKGCVNNWSNSEQTTIWAQYLKQLESYSCFPVFSHLYVNKQSNVALLFDILLGLPDKQDNKKWLQKEKESVKQLYMIIKDVFAVKGEQAAVVRQYALKSGFYSTMLDRLYLITKEPKRIKSDEIKEEEDEALPTIEKKNSEQDYAARLKKRTGVGYGTDSSSNQKWDVTGQEEARKQKSDQILSLLNILEQFLNCPEFEYPPELLDQTYESSLLPILQSSLRGGSLLEITKYADLFKAELNFIDVIAKCKQLIPVLMSIPKCYEPKQSESICSLLKTLANTSNIFLSCLTGSASEKTSEEIAKKISQTYQLVESAVSEYEIAHHTEDEEEKRIMELPLQKKYPLLMKDLRFDYIDMKDTSNKITKHHYASSYQPGHKPPVDKTIRLAQELADLSHALPIDHTNAIYVRCDKERVDFMQALIMGSNGTPYGHGAYLFDIYFEDNYPNGPPKVNLMTTGSGQIRFNPNLYACGKVCLSLLGTWRGNAMQNWDAKVSTLLQVLVSIQSIIMSEDIYFNQPGFEHEQGTPQGEKKNQAYANIVRYGNVKFAMLQNIKNPPKGFQAVIRRHFYLKKDEILDECRKWLKFAQKREASYTGLISDHNYNWCNNFKKTKTEYKTLLQKAIKELEVELNKLPPPTHSDFSKQIVSPIKPRRKPLEEIKQSTEETNLEEIDVSYGQGFQYHQLDVNDEKVKDRWSRYIGAMGVEAVTKQSKANIVLLGLGAVGVQTAKNIVMSGCRQFAVWDDKTVKYADLSGQFYLSQSDIDKPRLQSCFYKLQQLNHYVKMTKFEYNPSDLSNLSSYQLVIATERSQEQLLKLDSYCRTNNIHFIAVDCYGPYGQIFNDFEPQFEVLDKDGEEPTEILIDSITNDQKGIVKLFKGYRHPYQDGDTVRLLGVKGMRCLSKEGQTINGTIHCIKVIDHTSFVIGNTTDYSPYQGQGTVKNLKTPKKLCFQSLQELQDNPKIESNLEFYDWSKNSKLKLVHTCFNVLDAFKKEHLRLPLSWNKEDASKFIELLKIKKPEISEEETKYAQLFSFTCSGTFGPICAFFGGITAQQAFKAITGKYTPINQYFISEFSEIIESPPEDEEGWNKYVQSRLPVQNRTEGLRRIVGSDIVTKLSNSKVFMVGSGAIGCELLKNFAMLEIATGEGTIVVTDPDHIENSNLNRQFLFREKHLRKPKSVTASAAVIQMNPGLKGHIKAKLDKVCEATRQLFSNQFFESQTIVANALDNVEARRYVDSRCVQSKTPMLQSGTLSSKGHVQVVIPYKTETYGSMQDPNDAQGQIPHCTLKMFPEQTLHCVQWARDLFGKEFTLGPKALQKLLQAEQGYIVGPSDIQMLRQCKALIENKPHSFDDAIQVATKVFYKIYRNDILQLLYTYPLDATTKDGKPFWKLPKRPPTSIQQIDPKDPLHNTFITSYSVLIAKIYGIPYPKDFRTHERRQEIAETARSIKVEPFQPSDKMAKEMADEVDAEAATKEEKTQMEENEQGDQNQQILYQKFKELVKNIKESGESVESHPEEFEKDDDQNGHIDLISSMANLRARNYKLEEMEWITVKLKAGRIMPALSTTTSCIAALQSIELVKYLCGCPLESMRNAFLNLAVPSLAMSEPGPVEKIKVHEDLQTSIWERWSVGPLTREQTIGDLIQSIEQKYGVSVKGLTLPESGQIYSDFVFSLESKKQEKEKLLSRKLAKLALQETGEEKCKYLDFTLVMGVGQTLIKHAPTLRLLFEI